MITSGIYKIVNKINFKFYIGSSSNIDRRWKKHLSELRKGKHYNSYLQNSFNKYGESSFHLEIIEETTNLMEREQHFLDSLQPYSPIGYNIRLKSSGGDGITNNPNRRKILKNIKNAVIKRYKNMTQKDKQDLSNKYSGKNNPFYGKTHSDETKRKLSKKKKKQYDNLSLEEKRRRIPHMKQIHIKGKIYENLRHAADELGVSRKVVCNRIHSKKHEFKDYYYLD